MKKNIFNISHLSKNVRGFSLVEVLLSLGIFILVVMVFVGGLNYTQESVMLSGEREQASFLAEEALEAVRSMRDQNFDLLTNGTHGLAVSGGSWNFSGSSDTTDAFNRSVTLSDIDSQTKLVVANVSWDQIGARSGSIQLRTQLSNWKALNPTQAEQLEIDVESVEIDPTDNTRVTNINIQNIGIETITVDKLIVSWSGASSGLDLTDIEIDGNNSWSGNNSSGSTEDITDFVMDIGSSSYPLMLVFDKDKLDLVTITIEFIMFDGSTKTTSFTLNAPPDTTAPSDITNLSISGETTSSITLDWTAPGDDNDTGVATSYDIRYSTAAINEGNWSAAIQVSGEPTPQTAGTDQSMTISGLNPITTYYFAMKTSDEVSNTSGLSNVASGTTLSPNQAGYLIVDTSGAVLGGVSGNRSVLGITLQNSGPNNIIISSMIVSWSGVNANRRLTAININGASVWTGNNNTGLVENITDTTISSGAAAVPLGLDFSNSISKIIINIVFTMSDGSIKTVSGIGPL